MASARLRIIAVVLAYMTISICMVFVNKVRCDAWGVWAAATHSRGAQKGGLR